LRYPWALGNPIVMFARISTAAPGILRTRIAGRKSFGS
jgi:hypothetical protein